MKRAAIFAVIAVAVGCSRAPGPARPRASTGARVSHGLNVGFAGANLGLSFFEAYASSRGAKRLDATAWTQYRQGVSSQPVPSIPIFQVGSLASGGSVLYHERDYKKTAFLLAGGALLLGIAGVVTTLAITAPNQSAIDGWDPMNPPADWEDYKASLQRANILRTVFHGAALSLNIAALAITW